MILDAITWLGHAGFLVRAGRCNVYIDPYRVDGGPPADLILVTHGHYDHFSPLAIEALATPSTWLVAPAPVAEQVRGNVSSIAPGEVADLDLAGLEVRAVPAYNTSKLDESGAPFHARGAGNVGFELRIGGERIYHSGDTDVIPEMDEVTGVDVALLAVSGKYVMTPHEAAEAARRIGPRVAVPMHWGSQIGTRADAEAFAAAAAVEVAILEPAAPAPVAG